MLGRHRNALVTGLASVMMWVAGINSGSTATITQASVTTNSMSQTYNFHLVWSGVPDLSVDQFQYKIMNPTTASMCCGPFTNLEGYASANSDYMITGVIGTSLSLDQHFFGGPHVATLPFTLNGNVLDFAVAFNLLVEPTGFVYLLDSFFSGALGPPSFLGTNNGVASPTNPLATTPIPNSFLLMAFGLAMMGLLVLRSGPGYQAVRGRPRPA